MAVIVNPLHPGHPDAVEHVSSLSQRRPEFLPSAKFNMKLATKQQCNGVGTYIMVIKVVT